MNLREPVKLSIKMRQSLTRMILWRGTGFTKTCIEFEAYFLCMLRTTTHLHIRQDSLLTASMRKILSRNNPCKAAGPDNIPGCLLKNCPEELKDVHKDIFKHLWASYFAPHASKQPQLYLYQISHLHPTKCTFIG